MDLRQFGELVLAGELHDLLAEFGLLAAEPDLVEQEADVTAAQLEQQADAAYDQNMDQRFAAVVEEHVGGPIDEDGGGAPLDDLDDEGRGESLLDVGALDPGACFEPRLGVLDVDVDKERISLGMKQLERGAPAAGGSGASNAAASSTRSAAAAEAMGVTSARLEELGIVLDTAINQAASGKEETCISSGNSPAAVYLTPVNEMAEMVRQYQTYIRGGSHPSLLQMEDE